MSETFNKGQQVASIRDVLGITRKEFSDALCLSKEQEADFKFWETGKKDIPKDVFDKILKFPTEAQLKSPSEQECRFTQIDLFAGIGGIRQGFQRHGGRTVFSSEWDKFAQKTYRINYGETSSGDITQIDPNTIPNHDILLAGFPCQPFSQAGLKKGFSDARGTLFFNIAEILRIKRPKAFMLENVKQLKGHDKGNTLKVILNILDELNYYVPEPEVLNAYHFGSPQNRERIIIVGFNKDYLPENFARYIYPRGQIDENINVGSILEKEVDSRFTISDKLYAGHLERKRGHEKKGNGFGFCLFNAESKYTSTISARYYKDGSEALIDQQDKNPRMLTPRECARLQGFPENFIIPVSNAQAYKQFGNSVCINVIDSVAKSMLDYLGNYNIL
ncbi:MAG: DNA cytosine methyltransferase [Clostridia bacterium]